MIAEMLQVFVLCMVGQVELVPTEDYSTRRFAEVIATAIESENLSPQERLIALRAKLVIAERQLDEMEQKRERAQTPQEREEAPKIVHIRAAKARVDHYRLRIEQIEKEVLVQKKAQLKKKR